MESPSSRAAEAPHSGHGTRAPSALDRFGDVATLLLAIAWLVRLAGMAAGARFATDECFHATVAQWIARHGRLPHVLPEFYSGFAAGYYPPLFHLVGAAAVAAFGAGSLRFLNVFVSALLLAALWLGARGLGAPAAGRWAVALSVANAWISTYAVRLYVEPLTVVLAVLALVLLLRVHRGGGWGAAIGLGAVVGAMLVTKQSALAVEGLVLGVAVFDLVRGEALAARRAALGAAVALVVAAPFFVRNAILFGSPIYPAFARDVDPLLFALNRARFTPAPLELYATTAGAAGPAILAAVLGALVLAAVRRRGSLALGLLVVCLALCLAGPLQALLDTRHLLPAIAGMALLACLVLDDLLGPGKLRAAITAASLLVMALFVATVPDLRRPLNVTPEQLDAFAAVAREVPEGERVLSLLTYDTFYYARRPATWPVPWGQSDRPIEMFTTTDCDSIDAALARHRLQYVLIWRPALADTFDGANYPAPFVRCLQGRVGEGRARLLWKSDFAALVNVPAAPPR